MTQNDVTARLPSSRQEKAQLRGMVHDAVLEFTRLRRQEIWRELTEKYPEWPQDKVQREVDRAQPEYQEYDPVVEMAVFAVDGRNPADLRLRAHSETAQYLRPKLKSIEFTRSQDDPESRARRTELQAVLAGLLAVAAAGKRATVIEGGPPRTVDPSPIGDEDGDVGDHGG